MMMFDDLIGQDAAGTTQKFYGGDEYQNFQNNLTKMPVDWYYRSADIKYIYNKLGHRCKEIDEINLDNYILFIGCSHTEGIGLELERSFPHLVSQTLGMDYYNLGIAASGIDVLEYNILTWHYKFQKLPKLVVIQWPDPSRFITKSIDTEHILPHGSWSKQENVKKFIASADTTGFLNARRHISVKLVENIVSSPLIKLSFNNIVQYDNDSLFIRRKDLARDLHHCGIKSHEEISKTIIDEYMRLYRFR